MITFTQHSRQQTARRGLTAEDVEYVTWYGQRLHRAGAIFYYLRRRDMPASDRRHPALAHLEGCAVVLARDGQTVLTAWRSRENGLKHIRCKTRRNRPDKEAEWISCASC